MTGAAAGDLFIDRIAYPVHHLGFQREGDFARDLADQPGRMLVQRIATTRFDGLAPRPGQIVRQAIAKPFGDVLRIFRRLRPGPVR